MFYNLPVFDPTGVKHHPGTRFTSTPAEIAAGQALPTLPSLWLKNHPGGLTGIPLFEAGSQDQAPQLAPALAPQQATTLQTLRTDLPFPPLGR